MSWSIRLKEIELILKGCASGGTEADDNVRIGGDDDDDDDDDGFYMTLFSALELTRCTLVACGYQ